MAGLYSRCATRVPPHIRYHPQRGWAHPNRPGCRLAAPHPGWLGKADVRVWRCLMQSGHGQFSGQLTVFGGVHNILIKGTMCPLGADGLYRTSRLPVTAWQGCGAEAQRPDSVESFAYHPVGPAGRSGRRRSGSEVGRSGKAGRRWGDATIDWGKDIRWRLVERSCPLGQSSCCSSRSSPPSPR